MGKFKEKERERKTLGRGGACSQTNSQALAKVKERRRKGEDLRILASVIRLNKFSSRDEDLRNVVYVVNMYSLKSR